MKIDIHVHTKKTKSGDADARNINPDKFEDIIKQTEVKILAITNHNHFDISQYTEFCKKTQDICQIWPGVELDVVEAEKRSHLIVIVSPNRVEEFSEAIKQIVDGESEETFFISIEDMVNTLGWLDPIYIAHYYSKIPALDDAAIEKLYSLVDNKNRIIKEATNSLSAGIYISHGHQSIYGSDVRDWNEYINIAESLPDLRLPVESFEQFCLLLEKDEPTIDVLLSKKEIESLELYPFNEIEKISLKVFNDINVFFGSKGTGKTDILRAISKAYNEKGLRTRVYEASQENIYDHYDMKGEGLEVNLDEFAIDDCSREIRELKRVEESNITSLSEYGNYFSEKITNARARKIKIHDLAVLDHKKLERRFKSANMLMDKINEYFDLLESAEIKKIVDLELIEEAVENLKLIVKTIDKERDQRFIKTKEALLFNSLIRFVSKEISRKTGKPEKPKTTGFLKYARNRINIEINIKKILENLAKEIDCIDQYVGDLGDKGKLVCRTEIALQNGDITDSTFLPYKSRKKKPQKEFVRGLEHLKSKIYSMELFEELSGIFDEEIDSTVNDLSDLILFRKKFIVNGEAYNPSSGESSMLLLHEELRHDKEVYLLDEPEKSLGNDYINDVIVPMLKEKAKLGCKVFIATHDANIAVRTLPYNSIYRRHNKEGYSTYIGNPFNNYLVNHDDEEDKIDWKEISMKTLEGGKEAFGERGKIYGNL